MTPQVQPLQVLVALLRGLSSRDAASAAIGDTLDELHQMLSSGRGPALPAVWINARVARLALSLMLVSTPRVVRATRFIVRDAFRSVRRSPSHSLFVTAVLALAMAAGTVTFSVVDAVVLKPLPIEEPDRVVQIPAVDPDNRGTFLTPEIFWRLHDHPSSLESVTFVSLSASNSTSPVTIGPTSDRFAIASTIADTFKVFRMTPAMGRFWTSEDEARGDTDVAVLSYRTWREVLGGSPDVLGMTVTAYKRSMRVIGVAGPETDDPNVPLFAAAAWFPRPAPRNDATSFYFPIGRMTPGATIADVVADVQRAVGTNSWRPDVKRIADVYTSRVGAWMLLALGASGLVVLIACVNAANLMLTRSVERVRETGVRVSLGASRRRVAIGAMAEGLILSVFGSAIALLFAIWGVAWAKQAITTLPLGVFRGGAIALNDRVFGAAVAAAILTGVLVAIVPAWHASRASVITMLKDGAPTATAGRGFWRSAFLVTEVAAVSVLFVVSWMFVASLIRSLNMDLGLDRGHLIGVKPTMALTVPIDEARAQLERVPGVAAVAVTRMASPPIFGRVSGAWITNAFVPSGSAAKPMDILDYRVSTNAFDVMGIRFIRGSRWSQDQEGQPFTTAPVVLDERAASRLFGNLDPIGRQVLTKDPAGVHTVIGIVPTVRSSGPEDEPRMAAYFPLNSDSPRGFPALLVRSAGSPDTVMPRLREVAAPLVIAGGSVEVSSADDALRLIGATRRFTAALMSLFGIVGALIGAAGIYAVMTAAIVQQTREIGVRLALGATSRDVERQVLGRALRHLVIGLSIGLPSAWWLSRGFAALLFRVTPTDASVYVGVTVLMLTVGLVAGIVPARRAGRVDPIISLRA